MAAYVVGDDRDPQRALALLGTLVRHQVRVYELTSPIEIDGENFNYLNIVWNLGNIGNALMAGPNLVGLLFLAGIVAAITRQRLANMDT